MWFSSTNRWHSFNEGWFVSSLQSTLNHIEQTHVQRVGCTLSRLGKTLHLGDLNTESSHVSSPEHVICIFCIFPKGHRLSDKSTPTPSFICLDKTAMIQVSSLPHQEGVNYSGHLQPYCYDVIRRAYYKSWLSSGFWRQMKKGTQSLSLSYRLCRDCVFYPPSGFQAAHLRSITYFTGTGAEGVCRYYQRR